MLFLERDKILRFDKADRLMIFSIAFVERLSLLCDNAQSGQRRYRESDLKRIYILVTYVQLTKVNKLASIFSITGVVGYGN